MVCGVMLPILGWIVRIRRLGPISASLHIIDDVLLLFREVEYLRLKTDDVRLVSFTEELVQLVDVAPI